MAELDWYKQQLAKLHRAKGAEADKKGAKAGKTHKADLKRRDGGQRAEVHIGCLHSGQAAKGWVGPEEAG